MNITIVAPYCSLPSEPHFNRFWYLAELLSQSHDVLLITSNFKHYDKSFRRPEDAEAASQGRLKVMLLEEGGYGKNVSLGRVTSHHRFVKHFEKWLENCRPGGQDVVYSAYPLIATNLLLGKHKARLGYKLIIDVQDVWPESFSSVVPFLKKIPHKLLPFASRADRAYRCADALVAVSQTYLARAREANPDVPGEAVYIGTDFAATAPPPAIPPKKPSASFTWARSVTAMMWKPCAKAFKNFQTATKTSSCTLWAAVPIWKNSNNTPAAASGFTATCPTPT